jgi:protein-tyrosine phosphatase
MMTQSAAGPLGVQTPMIENPNVNPLFESVRQAMGLSTNITEEIPVRLPMGFSFDTMIEHLPKWLLSAITDGSGKARLAEYFQVQNNTRWIIGRCVYVVGQRHCVSYASDVSYLLS